MSSGQDGFLSFTQNATTAYPDNNPKTAIGVTKVPLHLVPPSAKHFLAMALADGAKKYGPYNWRDAAISVSVYKSACERHLDAFWDGQELAEDSSVHHLAHAMACLALMLDAMTVGKLHDDRPSKGNVSALQATYAAKKKEPCGISKAVDAQVFEDLADPRPRLPSEASDQAYTDYVNELTEWFKRNPECDT